MRVDLTDCTFLILVRIDSMERLENLLCITERISYYFKTNIRIRESGTYNSGILKSLLSRKIQYEFVEDKDPVLHKTKHFNEMISQVITPYLALWDTDIAIDKYPIITSVEQLRVNKADVAYPYNKLCYDVPSILRNIYLKKKDMRVLYRHINKMDVLYNRPLVGGAVIMNKQKCMQAGGENERHYGWGNDDFDRYYRFLKLKYSIYHADKPLFHLFHPRGNNSKFRSWITERISFQEILFIENSSKAEIEVHVKKTSSLI